MDKQAGNKELDICDRSILITGGTGSFGRAFVRDVLTHCPRVKRLVVFSRDELKQFEMQQEFPESEYPALRFFIGDVRDQNRLRRALEGIDTVVHAAALKQVPAAEYNPFEFIQTNIMGAQNLIEACMDTKVERVVALSTDKAAAPINLYGATKLCSDKLFVAANNFRGGRNLRFSVVRYGNVMGSRGSVIPFFMNKAKTGVLPITDPNMTRFNISLNEGVEMVFWALQHASGSEIFVPKISSYKIMDIASAIQDKNNVNIVGIRPGEKLHEELISEAEGYNTFNVGSYFVIAGNQKSINFYTNKKYKKMKVGNNYNSLDNPDFLTVGQLKKLINNYKKQLNYKLN